MEAQLDKLPLDLRPYRFPRSALRGVPVPGRSDAAHFPARIGVGCGTLFGLLDDRIAIAKSVDARQRCAQPFLGDAGLQHGLRQLRRMAPVLHCARSASATEPSRPIGGFEAVAEGISRPLRITRSSRRQEYN